MHELRGIGAPYDLQLPEVRESMIALPTPLPVRYAVLDGKQVGRENFEAKLIEIGRREATILAERPIAPMTHIRLRFEPTPEEAIRESYGTVLERPTDRPELVHVRFTSVSPEAERFIVGLLP